MNSDTSTGRVISRRDAIAGGLVALVVPRLMVELFKPTEFKSETADCLRGRRRCGPGLSGPACKDEEIVALCDLDHEYSAPAFKLYPKARLYKDFRQMFEKEEENFDALIRGHAATGTSPGAGWAGHE